MAESRVFMLNGVEPQTVVDRLENFLHNEKGMEVQSSPTAEGYVMQASQPENMWKTLTGMRLAITLQIVVTGEQMNVLIGEGQWTDKIGAGAIGLFVAWPLAITAGMELPALQGGDRSGRRRRFGCGGYETVPRLRRHGGRRLQVLQPVRRQTEQQLPCLRRRDPRGQRLLPRVRPEAVTNGSKQNY